eukprot:5828656-Alexandrium_andersonii.AAC.1
MLVVAMVSCGGGDRAWAGCLAYNHSAGGDAGGSSLQKCRLDCQCRNSDHMSSSNICHRTWGRGVLARIPFTA